MAGKQAGRQVDGSAVGKRIPKAGLALNASLNGRRAVAFFVLEVCVDLFLKGDSQLAENVGQVVVGTLSLTHTHAQEANAAGK